MRIISKYKDYYDYLQGIWGVDEKLVLDRTDFTITPNYKSYLSTPHISLIRFYICGMVVEGIYYQEKANMLGVFLYGEEIKQVLGDRIYSEDDTSKWSWRSDKRFYYIKALDKWRSGLDVLKEPVNFFELNHEPTGYYKEKKEVKCPTDFFQCPILIEQNAKEKIYDISKCEKFPILKDYDFYKVFPAQDMWLTLGEWLGKETIIPNNQSNKEKVLSNGFDLKTSFRHPIK